MLNSNKKQKVTQDHGTEKLIDGINDLIELRKSTGKRQELQYMSMYQNLDRMLYQLPKEIVEDLNMQFVQLTYEAVKSQRQFINIS
jgi:hypothetical protein